MENNKLYRSGNGMVIAGVCSGLGEYFNIDASIFRLIFICLAIFGGSGFPLYIIMALLIPMKKAEDEIIIDVKVDEREENTPKQDIYFWQNPKVLTAVLLMLVAGGLIVKNSHSLNIAGSMFSMFIPVILLAIGLYFLFRGNKY